MPNLPTDAFGGFSAGQAVGLVGVSLLVNSGAVLFSMFGDRLGCLMYLVLRMFDCGKPRTKS